MDALLTAIGNLLYDPLSGLTGTAGVIVAALAALAAVYLTCRAEPPEDAAQWRKVGYRIVRWVATLGKSGTSATGK